MLPPPPTGQPKEQKMGGGKGNSGNSGGGVPDPESAPMMQTDVLSYREMLICSEILADSLFFLFVTIDQSVCVSSDDPHTFAVTWVPFSTSQLNVRTNKRSRRRRSRGNRLPMEVVRGYGSAGLCRTPPSAESASVEEEPE